MTSLVKEKVTQQGVEFLGKPQTALIVKEGK